MSEMSPVLSFRAQSLDNLAPDPMMEENGKILEDQEHRQELVRYISRVSIDGSQVFSKGDISVFRYGNDFILEVPSDRRDSAGRIAPIICYGKIAGKPDNSWPDTIVKAIRDFAGYIGRGVSDEDASSARHGLEELVKKNTRTYRRS